MLKKQGINDRERLEKLREVGSREAAETAIDQSKELEGTWSEQLRKVRPIRNWDRKTANSRRH